MRSAPPPPVRTKERAAVPLTFDEILAEVPDAVLAAECKRRGLWEREHDPRKIVTHLLGQRNTAIKERDTAVAKLQKLENGG